MHGLAPPGEPSPPPLPAPSKFQPPQGGLGWVRGRGHLAPDPSRMPGTSGIPTPQRLTPDNPADRPFQPSAPASPGAIPAPPGAASSAPASPGATSAPPGAASNTITITRCVIRPHRRELISRQGVFRPLNTNGKQRQSKQQTSMSYENCHYSSNGPTLHSTTWPINQTT